MLRRRIAAAGIAVSAVFAPVISTAPVSAVPVQESAKRAPFYFKCGGYTYTITHSRWFGSGKYIASVGQRSNGARAAYVLVDLGEANLWITDVSTTGSAHVGMGPVWGSSACMPLRSRSLAQFAGQQNGVSSSPDWTLG